MADLNLDEIKARCAAATPGATDELLATLRKSVNDVRNHDHDPPGADFFCLNLVSFMGERMGAVLTRLDAETSKAAPVPALVAEVERLQAVTYEVAATNTMRRERDEAQAACAPLALHVKTVVPYVVATLPNGYNRIRHSKPSGEWGEVHMGRTGSSIRQLEKLQSEANDVPGRDLRARLEKAEARAAEADAAIDRLHGIADRIRNWLHVEKAQPGSLLARAMAEAVPESLLSALIDAHHAQCEATEAAKGERDTLAQRLAEVEAQAGATIQALNTLAESAALGLVPLSVRAACLKHASDAGRNILARLEKAVSERDALHARVAALEAWRIAALGVLKTHVIDAPMLSDGCRSCAK